MNLTLFHKDDRHGFTHELFRVDEETGLRKQFTGYSIHEQLDTNGNSSFIISLKKESFPFSIVENQVYPTIGEAAKNAVLSARKDLCPACKKNS